MRRSDISNLESSPEMHLLRATRASPAICNPPSARISVCRLPLTLRSKIRGWAALRPAIILFALLPACQRPLRPVFPEIAPPIQWPAPPDEPRVRYIGELSGEESLGKPAAVTLKSLLAGPDPTAGFSTPMGVAVISLSSRAPGAHEDRVFVADGQNRAVHVLDLATREYSVITHAEGGPLEWPLDVDVAGDLLAVADSRRAAVFLYDASGIFIRTVGDGILHRPSGVAWDGKTQTLWVVDSALHACVAFDANGRERMRVGGRGDGSGEFNYPAGIGWGEAVGLVVADSMNFRVQILDGAGRPVRSFGKKGDAAGDFALPRDVAVDRNGHIYVLDSQFENVQVFDAEGRLLMSWGGEGRGPGEFYLPTGICIDARERIWIADSYNRRVQVFQFLAPGVTRAAPAAP